MNVAEQQYTQKANEVEQLRSILQDAERQLAAKDAAAQQAHAMHQSAENRLQQTEAQARAHVDNVQRNLAEELGRASTAASSSAAVSQQAVAAGQQLEHQLSTARAELAAAQQNAQNEKARGEHALNTLRAEVQNAAQQAEAERVMRVHQRKSDESENLALKLQLQDLQSQLKVKALQEFQEYDEALSQRNSVGGTSRSQSPPVMYSAKDAYPISGAASATQGQAGNGVANASQNAFTTAYGETNVSQAAAGDTLPNTYMYTRPVAQTPQPTPVLCNTFGCGRKRAYLKEYCCDSCRTTPFSFDPMIVHNARHTVECDFEHNIGSKPAGPYVHSSTGGPPGSQAGTGEASASQSFPKTP